MAPRERTNEGRKNCLSSFFRTFWRALLQGASERHVFARGGEGEIRLGTSQIIEPPTDERGMKRREGQVCAHCGESPSANVRRNNGKRSE